MRRACDSTFPVRKYRKRPSQDIERRTQIQVPTRVIPNGPTLLLVLEQNTSEVVKPFQMNWLSTRKISIEAKAK